MIRSINSPTKDSNRISGSNWIMGGVEMDANVVSHEAGGLDRQVTEECRRASLKGRKKEITGLGSMTNKRRVFV